MDSWCCGGVDELCPGISNPGNQGLVRSCSHGGGSKVISEVGAWAGAECMV